MTIYYFMFEAKPLPDNPEVVEYEGAYINCWVNKTDKDEAFNEAKTYIESQGWEIIRTEDSFIVSADFYEDNSESQECFNQALEFGVSVIIGTWAIDPLSIN